MRIKKSELKAVVGKGIIPVVCFKKQYKVRVRTVEKITEGSLTLKDAAIKIFYFVGIVQYICSYNVVIRKEWGNFFDIR